MVAFITFKQNKTKHNNVHVHIENMVILQYIGYILWLHYEEKKKNAPEINTAATEDRAVQTLIIIIISIMTEARCDRDQTSC